MIINSFRLCYALVHIFNVLLLYHVVIWYILLYIVIMILSFVAICCYVYIYIYIHIHILLFSVTYMLLHSATLLRTVLYYHESLYSVLYDYILLHYAFNLRLYVPTM